MGIKTVGAATVWECTTCYQRYIGVMGEARAREWQAYHSKPHMLRESRWYWPDVEVDCK